MKLSLPSNSLCFGAAGPHSVQQVQAVLRYVTFSAYRSVGRLDLVAVLACLLPGELTVVRQAACFCRTVVGPPFVVVTQSHFTLFKYSSST